MPPPTRMKTPARRGCIYRSKDLEKVASKVPKSAGQTITKRISHVVVYFCSGMRCASRLAKDAYSSAHRINDMRMWASAPR